MLKTLALESIARQIGAATFVCDKKFFRLPPQLYGRLWEMMIDLNILNTDKEIDLTHLLPYVIQHKRYDNSSEQNSEDSVYPSLNFLSCTKLAKSIIPQVGAVCPSLKQLIFNNCSNLNSDIIHQITTHLPNITSLYLLQSTMLDSKALEHLSTAYGPTAQLRILFLDMISFSVSCEAISSFIIPFTNLTHFSLANAQASTTDTLLLNLAKYCPNLEYLALFRCTNISDSSYKSILSSFPKLTYLKLGHATKLSSETISSCAPSLSLLQELQLNNVGIPSEPLIDIVQNCKFLCKIGLAHLPSGITKIALHEMLKNCIYLNDLSLTIDHSDALKWFNISDDSNNIFKQNQLRTIYISLTSDFDVFLLKNDVIEFINVVSMLENLTIRGVDDDSFFYILGHMGYLKNIVCYVNNIKNENNNSNNIINNNYKLLSSDFQSLELYQSNITDDSLINLFSLHFGNELPLLKLDFNICSNISLSSISVLFKHFGRNLQDFRIRRCEKVSVDVLDDIAKYCINIRIVILKKCGYVINTPGAVNFLKRCKPKTCLLDMSLRERSVVQSIFPHVSLLKITAPAWGGSSNFS